MCFVDKCIIWVVVVVAGNVGCNPVVNNFNSSVREFAVPGDDDNSTTARTLQKEELARERYAKLAPVRSSIKFKDIADNALSSSSSHGRGLLHHEHNGYGLDYDDYQNYGHGDYHLQGTGHDLKGHLHGLDGHHGLEGHGLGHIGHGLYDHHHGDLHGHHETHLYHGEGHLGHGYGHGHHHKHLDHALAAKTIFWPIAGIALLGAAAALVSNPVLLQLGVVSGRRKRETEETTDIDNNSLRKWTTINPFEIVTKLDNPDKRITQTNNFKVIKPLDNFENKIREKDITNNERETVHGNKDPSKRLRMYRLVNINKRTVQKQTSDPAYVNQPDLTRTESDEDKHYIAVPLLTYK